MQSRDWSGFAEFFGEGFAVFEGDGVETVEHVEVIEQRDEGQGEEDGNHEPRAVEVVGESEDAESDDGVCDEDSEGDEDAELGGLASAGFHEVDFFGGHDGAEIAYGSVDEGGEE